MADSKKIKRGKTAGFHVVSSQNNESYKKKLLVYKSWKGALVVFGICLVLIGILGYRVYWNTKTFDHYRVRSVTDFTDAESMNCVPFGDYVIRYSMDGISCLDKSGSLVWGQAYEVKNPISDVCKDYIAIAAQRGNEIYVFNHSGSQGSISTPYPIVDIDVAAQGVVAVTMESGGMNYVNLYDKTGGQLTDNPSSLEQKGYPLAAGLSNDGKKLIVSFVDIANNKLENSLICYSFSDVGQNYSENLVGGFNSEELNGGLVPEVEFLTNDVAAAFSDKGVMLIRMKEIPSKIGMISVEEEIQSIFYDEKHIGLVLPDNTREALYRVCIYDLSGKMILEKKLTEGYSNIGLSGDQVIVYNDSQVHIFTLDGRDRFRYTFDKEIIMFKRISGYRYIWITLSSISEIQLK